MSPGDIFRTTWDHGSAIGDQKPPRPVMIGCSNRMVRSVWPETMLAILSDGKKARLCRHLAPCHKSARCRRSEYPFQWKITEFSGDEGKMRDDLTLVVARG